MSNDTDTTKFNCGNYLVVNGCVSMFGCSDLKIMVGSDNLKKIIEEYDNIEPKGEILDTNNRWCKESTYLIVILKSKTSD